MGLSFSSILSPWNEIPSTDSFDSSENIEKALEKSISFGSKSSVEGLEQSPESEKTMLKTAVPIQGLVVSENSEAFSEDNDAGKIEGAKPDSLPMCFSSPRPIAELDDAATKLQKVYKSYRTRRNLADCAVIVEELWWKTLDSADLERISISFFNSCDQETAASRWGRAGKRASKLGKGLLKDEKAQTLALHHWLEAIDPRHRYGRNLHFYYDVWSDRKSYQPFFYWLDIGDGKELNLASCPRADLNHQCIQYLGLKEREQYEVIVEDGKLVYKQSGTLLDTDDTCKWIFVLSTSRSLYIGRKRKGCFQHSSFLSGAVTTAAGRLVAHGGILEKIWPYSGHYLPTEDHLKEFIAFLKENHVDMTNVEICSIEDDSPEAKVPDEEPNPENDVPSSVGINTANINAPKLDLTKTLSAKWTSGVGPRIGCVRDYPIELQSRALEKVHLSPSSGRAQSNDPIPSLRPSPTIRMSPRLANMGLPISPRVSPLSGDC